MLMGFLEAIGSIPSFIISVISSPSKSEDGEGMAGVAQLEAEARDHGNDE